MTMDRQAGHSLLEASAAAGLAVLVGLGVVGTVIGSRDGAEIVRQETTRSESLRDAAEQLVREIKQTNSSKLSVTTGSDGNHIVTLQTPLSVNAGVVTWGVRDAVAGDEETDRDRADWQIRYQVATAKTKDGRLLRWLVREILDDKTAVRTRDILLRGVAHGKSTPAGFTVTANGKMWRVSLGVDNGDALAFDIALLN